MRFDPYIWLEGRMVSRRLSTSYDFYKFDKQELDDE